MVAILAPDLSRMPLTISSQGSYLALNHDRLPYRVSSIATLAGDWRNQAYGAELLYFGFAL
jgi:hypothetical protein